MREIMKYLNVTIAVTTVIAIALTLVLRYVVGLEATGADWPVLTVLVGGGSVLVFNLVVAMCKGEFGSDLLAGISIVTSVLLGEYIAGALVVLMLSGGTALEEYAMRRASSVLDALARRMPSIAHKRSGVNMIDVAADEVRAGDEVVVLPHELCPVDGVVLEGRSSMDESYLTGEPYRISKTPGCEVISGAINGEGALIIRANKEAKDSRYAKIMQVMDISRQKRPHLRRLADRLGALYTPTAVIIALVAWGISGEAQRFLAVLVVATPCPLIIAIPVAIIGAISWSAKRGIIIKDPIALERAHSCVVLITDKTGTLTIGEPRLVEIEAIGIAQDEVLRLAASIEKYSKHPLAQPVIQAAEERHLLFADPSDVQEVPGRGLVGIVAGRKVTITGRRAVTPDLSKAFSAAPSGLECLVLIDGAPAAVFRFQDEARPESKEFVMHLGPQHDFKEIILLSGDRDEEVQYLAKQLHISKVYSGKSPEEKVDIVRAETARAQTLYLGDGINDAPALTTATVGVAFGPRSDITSEAAGAVILEPSLRKVDQFLHISSHMRRVALQSAVGGMVLSMGGMLMAAVGYLTPVGGALLQEVIDLLAVGNALRASSLGRSDSNHI
jgi:heavy metal translocating P-type ATPase